MLPHGVYDHYMIKRTRAEGNFSRASFGTMRVGALSMSRDRYTPGRSVTWRRCCLGGSSRSWPNWTGCWTMTGASWT